MTDETIPRAERHDRFRELLALRLYDELDEAEATAVEAHLAGCADCRDEAEALAGGLGVLAARAAERREAFPAGWRQALREATDAGGSRTAVARTTVWRAAALGFAAGILATLALVGLMDGRGHGARPPGIASERGDGAGRAVADGEAGVSPRDGPGGEPDGRDAVGVAGHDPLSVGPARAASVVATAAPFSRRDPPPPASRPVLGPMLGSLGAR